MNTTVKQTSPSSFAADVQKVMRVIDSFSQLLMQETAALRKTDFKTVDTLQAEKRHLAREYQEIVTTLAGRKAEMAQLDVAARERLVQARTRFTLILDDNLRALEAAKNSAARLVGKILDAARRSVADDRQTNYSAKGKSQAYKTSTLSLSVDQKL